ncbi:porin [Bradyrhizobium symbiodeficiens]|uniref:porin n=1 Tax=Bradyrhizobium symbiodeficiens TaxID=1404367 RepID=UPI000BA1C1AA|nr:porin [Bradyrhizobium symbiodeficiens]AWM07980.1 porin [Bradyrhizobium symbiodeficiens]
MKLVKSLLLGSAAGLIAVGGAQAADLPVKAKAVEYVRICSLYGAGFYYIPGTDTCIKLGGYLRAEVALNTNSVYNGQFSGVGGAHNRLSNYYTMRSRQDLNIDTRTATEYGVVRTFFDATFSWTTGGYAGAGAGLTGGTTAYDAAPAGTSGSGSVAGGALGVYYAFIQFAGFTMGKAVSQFSAPWTNYPGNNFDGLVGGGGTVTGVNQFTYTADFGQGITAAISAQDQAQYYQAGVINASGITAAGILGGAYGVGDYGGSRMPDIVGMVRIDQAWGLFQLSAAAHENHVGYYGASEVTGHPDDKWGWAVQAALSIKNIPTGAGDSINLQGVYTDGATRYNIQDLASVSYSMFGSSGLAGAYQSIGFASAPDTVFIAGGSQESIKTWGFRGAYTHNWDPYWNTAIYGAYAGIQYTGASKTFICGSGAMAAALTAGSTCDPDFNIAQLGLITRWTPVKNLTFSADFTWTHLDQKYSGVAAYAGNAATAKPAAFYELKDQDSLNLLLRAQRNW